VMDRRGRRYRVELPAREKAAQLDILIEAAGRVNFGVEVYDRKGLHAPVEFSSQEGSGAKELRDWEIFPLQLDEQPPTNLKFRKATAASGGVPAFWRGTFEVARAGDTFLDLRGWGKGVVWVNGHCLGRFWNIGPTQTMYLPGPWLRAGRNDVVVLDLLGPRGEPKLAGLAKPVLDELHPELDFARRERPENTFSASGVEPIATGSFSAVVEWQPVKLEPLASGRYLCLEAISAHFGSTAAAVSELDVIDGAGKSVPKNSWKILWVSSEELSELAGEAENILDGQSSSFWQSSLAKPGAPYPHRIVVDLGARVTMGGIMYHPKTGKPEAAGRIKDYKIYLSDTPFGLVPR
jgi:beta-galactosidase